MACSNAHSYTFRLTSTASGNTIKEGEFFSLTARAMHTSGYCSDVNYYEVTYTGQGLNRAISRTFYANNNSSVYTEYVEGSEKLPPGKYTYTAKVTSASTHLSGLLNKSASVVITVEALNTAPTISGTDTNLGDKNNGFNVEYSVNDADITNTLTVTERLNSTVLRTINNATRNEPYTISITDEQIKELELNSSNRVQIEVSDGQGGIAYRNYTFTKSNSAPIVTGQDEDLGGLVNPFSKTYQVYDQEGDVITVTEKLNGTVLRQFVATHNTDYTVTINEELWQTLGNETHVLTVEATDSIGSTTVRTFTFRRLVNSILLELKEPSETDAKASKIMVVPVWRGINNADVVVSACNNALDVAPTWEDITDAVLNNIPYMFTNEAKTSEKWGVNIKFEITRKEGTTEQIILDGFGGAFE